MPTITEKNALAVGYQSLQIPSAIKEWSLHTANSRQAAQSVLKRGNENGRFDLLVAGSADMWLLRLATQNQLPLLFMWKSTKDLENFTFHAALVEFEEIGKITRMPAQKRKKYGITADPWSLIGHVKKMFDENLGNIDERMFQGFFSRMVERVGSSLESNSRHLPRVDRY